jgi:tetratricopeptide (TPR) repeat protein
MPGPHTSGQPPLDENRAGNVYHKAERVPRSRHEAVHKIDSAGGADGKKPNDPARTVTLQNLRRFALFTLAMAAVVFLSIKVLMYIWSLKDRENQSSDPVDHRGASEVELPRTGTGNKPGENPEKAGDGTIDTEAIRKAVFLAKRAKALAQSGAYDEAIARYRDALDVWPYLTQVWAELGRLYLQTRDFQKAQIALEKALDNDPGSPEILNDLSVASLYLGQTDKCMKLLETVLEIAPQYAPPYFNMALCHMSKSDKKTAREFLERYLRLRGDDPRALREVAFLDASTRRYPEALDALEKAIIEKPDWALLYFDAAACAALMGRADDAINYLERSLPLSNPASVYRLYREPAFNQVRLSEIGIEFEKEIAQRAKQAIESGTVDNTPPTPTQPILSSDLD